VLRISGLENEGSGKYSIIIVSQVTHEEKWSKPFMYTLSSVSR
jgi:hypothetical protein